MAERDTPDQIPFWGFAAPAAILLAVCANLILGGVYWPQHDQAINPTEVTLFTRYTDGPRFWGTVMLKLGMAGGIFGWCGLANYPKWERAALPTIGIGVMAAVAGLMLFVAKFLL
jgi:hypothetical protein